MCQWIRYAKRFPKGYRAFVFDFRNHGLSQKVGSSRSWRYAADVAAATRFVRARGARKVFLVGGSMGGTAVLAGGAHIDPPVDGVVSLSAACARSGVPDAARWRLVRASAEGRRARGTPARARSKDGRSADPR
jgi:alpha-beta hydrolase superfamily lysophospholipase